MSQQLRDLFADELPANMGLAQQVRDGTDNSIGGTAAIRAMQKAVAAERERCAKVAEKFSGVDIGVKIAAAIRKGE